MSSSKDKKSGFLVKKQFTPTLMFIQALCFICFGIILIAEPNLLERLFSIIVCILILFFAIPWCISLYKDSKRIPALIAAVILPALAATFLIYPIFFQVAISLFFGFLFLVLALIRLLMIVQCKIMQIPGMCRHFISMIVSFIFSAIVFAFSANENLNVVFLVSGIYLIIYGISVAIDAFSEILLDTGSAKRIKKSVRIALPVFITAMLPGQTIDAFNRYFKTVGQSKGTISQTVLPRAPKHTDLEILIHTGESGLARIGHVDIRYKDMVISYGTYDEHSIKLGGFLCDGVFVFAPFKPYLKNCLEQEHKVLIGFGIELNDDERQQVVSKLDELKSQMIRFYCDYELWEQGKLKEWNHDDFTCKLVRDTGAKLYKTPNGPFRKYVAVNTNCVQLAETIIDASGLDVLAVHGIPTPGTYLDNLNYLFEIGNSMVVNRTIYTGGVNQAL